MDITIFELYDGLACYPSHDIREVDMQGVLRYRKVEVDETTAKKIQESVGDKLEELLKII